jgi:hypothetical protein
MDTVDRLIEEAYNEGAVAAVVNEEIEQVADLSNQIKPLATVHAKNRARWIFAGSDQGKDFFNAEEREQLKRTQGSSSRDLSTKIDELRKAEERLQAMKSFADVFRKKVNQN